MMQACLSPRAMLCCHLGLFFIWLASQGSRQGGFDTSINVPWGAAPRAARRAQRGARAERQQAKEVKRARGLAKSLLHKLHWQRIVLDEAHAIKDRRSSTAQAAFALSAAYRWCLSGTPLQNRVGELYSLVQFLQLDPYCYFFCKVRSRQ